MNLISLILYMIMKSKDFQNLVLSKYENSQRPTKIFRDLNGFVGVWTIQQ